MKKIFFVSHDASRSGAPMLLLHFIRWLKVNTNIPFQIILKTGGVLEPEFQLLGPVINISREVEKEYAQVAQFMKRILHRLAPKKFPKPNLQTVVFNRLKKRLRQEDIGLIYSNTITNGEVLELLEDINAPIITHVHELGHAINLYFSQDNIAQIKRHTHYYIAAAEAVKDNLISSQKIASNKIDVIHGFIPIQHNSSTEYIENNHFLRKHLNISQETLIVGASGTTEWRKGADLFILLARTVHSRKLNIPVHFVWVGSHSNETYLSELLYDVKQANLEEYVHFLGSKPNPLDYFRDFDIFTLLSREDPFPLVVLEAASLGKPIICFDKAGGAKELVENDCGFVVPYLDIEAIADKVLMLSDSKNLRQKLGQCAAQKVAQRYSIDKSASKILALIKRLM
ncbi:MAG: glycosyltransferase family 4 protein [Rhizonema sp. NSF051]|nr:glycosyltransferase family 4 protein [Rhizonema sp. NSF051]